MEKPDMQIIERKNKYKHTRNLDVSIGSHQPSWKRPMPDSKKGGAFVKFQLGDYTSGTALSIDAAEWYTNEQNRTSEKRVMMSINEDAARQLWQMLNEKFGEQ